MNTMLAAKRSVNSILLPSVIILILLGALAPLTMFPTVDSDNIDEILEPTTKSYSTAGSVESYDLYLDRKAAENGGDGAINTTQPDSGHIEQSALGGLEFRSSEMISDLQIFGETSTQTGDVAE